MNDPTGQPHNNAAGGAQAGGAQPQAGGAQVQAGGAQVGVAPVGEWRRACDQVRVRVPATSANLGPGFDAFGLALTLYDDLVVTPGGSGVQVSVSGCGEGEVPLDATHLVVRSIQAGLEALGAPVPGFTLRCENRIPHGRGLGSSSAAIVGGLAAAYALAGEPLDRDRLVLLANELEGHPDNVAAAAFGGFTIAWTEGGNGRAVKLEPAAGTAAVAYVPDNRVLTKQARGLLPSVVSHTDAAANAGKAALLVAALTGRPELLLTATEDRLHQEYREPVMPESLALVHKLRGSGLAAIVSGAGPTVAVLGGHDDKSAGQDVFSGGTPDAPDGWTKYELRTDPVGVQVWSMEAG